MDYYVGRDMFARYRCLICKSYYGYKVQTGQALPANEWCYKCSGVRLVKFEFQLVQLELFEATESSLL